MFWKRKQHSTQEQIQRMHDADAILQNPIFIEACDKLASDYYNAWLNTSPLQADLREKLYLAQVSLEGVKKNLKEVMSEGQLATMNEAR